MNYKEVTIILPSHNEEKIIKMAIESLLKQTYWDIEIYICLDNCTDNTEQIVNDNFSNNDSIKVFKSKNNKHKKAGALNQLFNNHFKTMKDYILIMDADTILDKRAIEEGVRFLNKNEDHGAICSSAGLLKPEKANIIWHLQNIEYGLSDSGQVEKKGKIFCCRGMFSMYNKKALAEIIEERKTLFDLNSITEDYELTLMLKKNRWKISANTKIKAFTDVPTKIKELYVQRVRWTTGGFLDLINHKFTYYTRRDIISMTLYLLIVFLQMYLLTYFIGYGIMIQSFSLDMRLLIASFIIILVNNLIRMKYIQYKDKITYLILFTVVLQIISFYFDIIVILVSLKNIILKNQINWR